MFEGLADKLQAVFDKLNRRGVLNEQDVDVALREVRLALLEAMKYVFLIPRAAT